MARIYPAERSYYIAALIFSSFIWFALFLLTFGAILLYAGLAWVVMVMMSSSLISHLKGNAIKVTPQQFPSIYEQVEACCKTLDLKKIPEIYIMNSNGVFNAFATHFLRKKYVVLMSPIVDSLQSKPSALKFYLGHELGHIKRKHVGLHAYLIPFRILPIFGQAYSRACEYTCDLHGLACCDDVQDAYHALSVLSAGRTQWQHVNQEAFCQQAMQHSKEFWMSFTELCSSHPWLSKRCYLLSQVDKKDAYSVPRKNALAYIPACFIPNLTGNPFINLIVTGYIIIMLVVLGVAGHQYETRQHALSQYASSANYQSYP